MGYCPNCGFRAEAAELLCPVCDSLWELFDEEEDSEQTPEEWDEVQSIEDMEWRIESAS